MQSTLSPRGQGRLFILAKGHLSVVCRLFSFQTIELIIFLFTFRRRTKFYIFGPGHMTEMAALPIEIKKSFQELIGRLP